MLSLWIPEHILRYDLEVNGIIRNVTFKTECSKSCFSLVETTRSFYVAMLQHTADTGCYSPKEDNATQQPEAGSTAWSHGMQSYLLRLDAKPHCIR